MSETGRGHYGLRLHSGGRKVIRQKADETEDAYVERGSRVEERNHLRTRLKETTQELRDALHRNHFALQCLDSITRYITHVGQPDQQASPRPLVRFPERKGDEVFRLRQEINEVERRLLDVQEQKNSLFQTLRRLTKFVVSGPQAISDPTAHPDGDQRSVSCEHGVEKDSPRILYRLQNDSKASDYNNELGICCPGWKKYSSADSPIAKGHVIQHLRDEKTSPPFISVHESPARIINLRKCVAFSEISTTKVLVINFNKLQKLGSWCRRSTEVVEELDISKYNRSCPDGVQYVIDSHWLIHRWVPQECIETEMRFDDFRSFCKGIGIVEC